MSGSRQQGPRWHHTCPVWQTEAAPIEKCTLHVCISYVLDSADTTLLTVNHSVVFSHSCPGACHVFTRNCLAVCAAVQSLLYSHKGTLAERLEVSDWLLHYLLLPPPCPYDCGTWPGGQRRQSWAAARGSCVAK